MEATIASGNVTLGVHVVHTGVTTEVRLTGELDIATAPRLDARLRELTEPGSGPPPQVLVVDLADLRFMDAAGLAPLLKVDQALRAAGGRLVLRRPQSVVARLLEVLGRPLDLEG